MNIKFRMKPSELHTNVLWYLNITGLEVFNRMQKLSACASDVYLQCIFLTETRSCPPYWLPYGQPWIKSVVETVIWVPPSELVVEFFVLKWSVRPRARAFYLTENMTNSYFIVSFSIEGTSELNFRDVGTEYLRTCNSAKMSSLLFQTYKK